MGRKNAKPRRTVPNSPKASARRRFHRPSGSLLLLAGAAAVAAVGGALLTADWRDSILPDPGSAGADQAGWLEGRPSVVCKWRRVGSLDELLKLSPEELEDVDIAEMNLLCATGMPGAEDMDIAKCLARLDQWAARVRHETERHLYRLTDPAWKEHAEHYGHSEARFRAEWLVAVLQQDIGLHYHAGFVPQDVDVPPFKTSKETFLHGLMDHEDAHKSFGGNCVSLPVAYAAVGRRLGYPVRLVSAKEHVFCRWEGTDSPCPAWRDRFNFDGAGAGFSIDPDEFYLSWPRKTTPDQVALCDWLKTLTAADELAVFLAGRGGVLFHVNGDYGDALVALAHSARLRPDSSQSVARVREVCEKIYGEIVAAHPEAYRQMVARLDAEDRKLGGRSALPPDFTELRPSGRNLPWWKTEAGRAANLAEVHRLNKIGQQNTPRATPPSRLPRLYHPVVPGTPQSYQALPPGQTPRR